MGYLTLAVRYVIFTCCRVFYHWTYRTFLYSNVIIYLYTTVNNVHVYSSRSTLPRGGKKIAKGFDSVSLYNIQFMKKKKNVFQNTKIRRYFQKKKKNTVENLQKTDECYEHRDIIIVGNYTIFYEAKIYTYPVKFLSQIVFRKQRYLFKTIEYKPQIVLRARQPKTKARDK